MAGSTIDPAKGRADKGGEGKPLCQLSYRPNVLNTLGDYSYLAFSGLHGYGYPD